MSPTTAVESKVGLSSLAIVTWALALCGAIPAHAEPVDMAPQHYAKSTRDGWNLSVDITNERVNSVPNLAAAANSREAFVTFSATARAIGGGPPITDSVFIAGYQLGCQSDVSSGLGIGGAGAAGANASLGGLPGVAGGLTGFVQTTIQPGVIVDVPMANMALNDGTAILDVDNIHIKPTLVAVTSPLGLTHIYEPRLPQHIRRSRSTATPSRFNGEMRG